MIQKKKIKDRVLPLEKWLFLMGWIIAVAIFTSIFCYYLYLKFEIIKTQYLLTRLKLENRKLLLEYKELELEYEATSSLKRIREEAEELGMREPTPKDIVYAKPKKNLDRLLSSR